MAFVPRQRRQPALVPSGGHTTGRFPVSPWRAFSSGKKRPPVVIWLPALLVSLIVLVPLGYLLLRATGAGSSIWPLIFRERTAMIWWNTLTLAAGVSVTTIVIAVPLAWLTTRTDLPLRRFWATIAALPLVIPSYAGALAVIGALGPRGLLQSWLEPLGVDRIPSIYGYVGAWATLSLFTYPYVLLAVRATLRGLDPCLEDASRSLGYGPWRTFFTCTLPQLRPAIGAGALLVALYTVSDFGVVTLMRYEAFTRAIYTQYRAAFDRTLAAALGVMLVIFAVGLLVAESRIRGRAAYHRLGSGSPRAPRAVALGKWKPFAVAYCGLIAMLSLGVPISTLIYWLLTGTSTGNQLADLPASTINSVLAAVLAAAAATLAALPIAVMAVRYGGRFSATLERLSYIGYALPGIVIALAFVFIGARYLSPIYQTLPLMILAMMVRFLPQAVGSVRASLLQISPRLEEAARTLGQTQAKATARITIPLAWPGIAAGAVLVFLTVMKELPVTLLLRPTGFDTLATEIWGATDSGAYGRAAAPALLLIVVSAVPTLLLSARSSR